MLPILVDGAAVVRLAGILEFSCGHSRTSTRALASRDPRPRLSWAERKGKGCWPWSPSPCGHPPAPRPHLSISAPAPRGALRPFPACQSNPALGSSSVAKRKQISKHTSARCFPPTPSWPLLQAPRGLPCPGLSQAELKPDGSEAEVRVEGRGRGRGWLWRGREGEVPASVHWVPCLSGDCSWGWRRNLGQIRATAVPSPVRRGPGGGRERGRTPQSLRG